MQVHGHALKAYSRTTVGPVGRARPAAPSAEVATDETAHVTVSAEAGALAAKSGGVDDKKIEALRAQIETGEYKVNPQMLAMRLLDALG